MRRLEIVAGLSRLVSLAMFRLIGLLHGYALYEGADRMRVLDFLPVSLPGVGLVLPRLAREGLIRQVRERRAPRGRRTYEITDAGVAVLDTLLRDSVSQAALPVTPLDTLVLAVAVLPAEAVMDGLRKRLKQLNAELVVSTLSGPPDDGTAMEQVQAELRARDQEVLTLEIKWTERFLDMCEKGQLGRGGPAAEDS